MTFSKRLQELRDEKGYTQDDMARFLNMSQQGYGKIEIGQREASYEKLVILSNIFSVSIDFLLKGNDHYDVTFGKRIKILREKNNWTQEYLANKLNVSSKTVISNYETDYSEPNFDTLIKLSQLFKVSTDYLLGIEVEK